MGDLHILHGGCQCGRNTYEIEMPKLEQAQLLEQAHVFIDTSELTHWQGRTLQPIPTVPWPLTLLTSSKPLKDAQSHSSHRTGRYHSAPLTAHLRVPLPWFHSSTHSFFPEETHASIRRSSMAPLLSIPTERMILNLPHIAYTPAAQRFVQDMSHVNRQDRPALPCVDQRYFCGFCGTHMTRWDEANRQRAEYIAVSLGSLEDEDVELLQDIGLLPPQTADESESVATHGGDRISEDAPEALNSLELSSQGATWFRSLVEDSQLGRLGKVRTAGTHEQDGIITTWVVEELENGGVVEQVHIEEPSKLSDTSRKRKTRAGD